MDKSDWWDTVNRVTKSQTGLSGWTRTVNIIVFINHLCQMFPGYSYIFSLPFECPWKLWQEFCFVLQVGRKKDNIIKYWIFLLDTSVQFSSVSRSCPTLCNPMNCRTPGLPVHHQLPEFIQTHAHWVSDVIPPSHPLLSPLLLPPIFPSIRVFSNESTLASGSQSIGISASTPVPPMNTQDWFPLGWTGWISLQSKGLSRVFSNTTVQKHQFFSA